MKKFKRISKTLAALGLVGGLLLSSVGTVSASGVHYKDVNKNHNFYNSVEYLLEKKAISDTLPNFRPYEDITRGQFASIFAKALGLDVSNVKNPGFKDVPESHQFYKYVAALENEGIIGGYDNGKFGINDKLTRGQMSGILVKTYNVDKVSDRFYASEKNELGLEGDRMFVNDIFDGWDEKFIGGQWSDELATLEYFGIMSGYKDGNMHPNMAINRSQFANMVYKMELNGVDHYFYQTEDSIINGLLYHDATKKQALAYLAEFLNADDNKLAKQVKTYWKSIEDGATGFQHNYRALRGISTGEYVTKDGKFKFTVTRGGKYNWWLSSTKVVESLQPETEQPETETPEENGGDLLAKPGEETVETTNDSFRITTLERLINFSRFFNRIFFVFKDTSNPSK
ncbi:S-layer homology domain-containing protein [Ureibacillus composti]